MKNRHVLFIIAAFFASALGAFAQAKRPISTVPFTITKPGNYYLTKNLVVTKLNPKTGSDAIIIAASDVTLDLNGREISTTIEGGTGITTGSAIGNVRIMNGTVRGFATGVFLAGQNYVIENTKVFDSKEAGIYVFGNSSTVKSCTVQNTGGGSNMFVHGIRVVGARNKVSDCLVFQFTRDNPAFEIIGIVVGSTTRIEGNTVSSAQAGAALTTGIRVGQNGYVEGNIIEDFSKGIDFAGSLSVYRDNSTYNCTTKFTGGKDGGGNN